MPWRVPQVLPASWAVLIRRGPCSGAGAWPQCAGSAPQEPASPSGTSATKERKPTLDLPSWPGCSGPGESLAGPRVPPSANPSLSMAMAWGALAIGLPSRFCSWVPSTCAQGVPKCCLQGERWRWQERLWAGAEGVILGRKEESLPGVTGEQAQDTGEGGGADGSSGGKGGQGSEVWGPWQTAHAETEIC